MFLLRDTHDHCDRRDHNNNNNIALTFTVCREKDSKSDLILISIGQVTAALRKKPWWTTTTSFAARSSILLLDLEIALGFACLPTQLYCFFFGRSTCTHTGCCLITTNEDLPLGGHSLYCTRASFWAPRLRCCCYHRRPTSPTPTSRYYSHVWNSLPVSSAAWLISDGGQTHHNLFPKISPPIDRWLWVVGRLCPRTKPHTLYYYDLPRSHQLIITEAPLTHTVTHSTPNHSIIIPIQRSNWSPREDTHTHDLHKIKHPIGHNLLLSYSYIIIHSLLCLFLAHRVYYDLRSNFSGCHFYSWVTFYLNSPSKFNPIQFNNFFAVTAWHA